MNSVERHHLALTMQEADRVPVAPSFLTRTSQKAGVRQYDYHTNPDVLASAQIDHCDRYDFDGVYIMDKSEETRIIRGYGKTNLYPHRTRN